LTENQDKIVSICDGNIKREGVHISCLKTGECMRKIKQQEIKGNISSFWFSEFSNQMIIGDSLGYVSIYE
jgi:hypothetical protein